MMGESVTSVLIVLLMLLAVVAVVVAAVAFTRRGEATQGAARTDPLADYPEVYDPLAIGVGDIVTYAGVDHVVRGTITMNEEGFVWREHLLDGKTGKRWLTVEDDEGDIEMALWMRREGTGLQPGGDVVLDDRVYREVESGAAQFTAEGTTGTAPSGTVDYADYRTADETGMLSFERWARTQSWEVSTGREVLRGELVVIHAGGPRT